MSFRLSVKNLKVSYKKFKITNISFELEGGDILGLVGRSGQGKSTLLKTISGLKSPDSGKIEFFYKNKSMQLNRYLGYSTQSNALYPFLTLEENIRVFGKLNNLKSKQIESNMNILLERLDLQKKKKVRINEFSGGMEKRADLAVALIHSPAVIVLDEPFTWLDIALQHFIWDFLKELSSQGRIILLSSHMLSDLQQNCNIFSLIERGVFYNHEQINKFINQSKKRTLEFFLNKLFTKFLMED